MARAYYNENDPFAAQWLRNLIAEGHIASGDVDDRSIEDVRVNDIAGYTQCHFFAGIGVWSHALRLAGWSDSDHVWTGSCPCQPFSVAGKRMGVADQRHLWPAWYHLIVQCRPSIIFGEQVASAAEWVRLVRSDLEAMDYAVGAIPIEAASAGAFHKRDRFFFVANTLQSGRTEGRPFAGNGQATRCSIAGELAYAHGGNPGTEGLQRGGEYRQQPEDRCASRMGDADVSGPQRRGVNVGEHTDKRPIRTPGLSNFWSDAEWIPCTDGKARPIEPGTFPLVNGTPGRVGRLRAYGNAIVPQVAAEFIAAAMECLP